MKLFRHREVLQAQGSLQDYLTRPFLSEEVFWTHGHSTGQDFIYVTTQFMSKEMLTLISDAVGPNRSLLICCKAFRCDPSQFPNLTLKKIPHAVLTRCEWGKDGYRLAVMNLPPRPVEPGTQTSLFEEAQL
jgi:adenine-specific DNA-methyltransferase